MEHWSEFLTQDMSTDLVDGFRRGMTISELAAMLESHHGVPRSPMTLTAAFCHAFSLKLVHASELRSWSGVGGRKSDAEFEEVDAEVDNSKKASK